jgi:hypothetical protein
MRTLADAAQATIETCFAGRHELGIGVLCVTSTPAGPANRGCWIWYSVIAQGGMPPANPSDFRKSFFAKQKKHVIESGFDYLGKAAFFAVQIENDGKEGPGGRWYRR